MAKMNTPTYKPAAPKSVLQSTGAQTRSYEGGVAYERDAKSELFMLGVSYLAGEDTFYEKASDREDRFRGLIEQVIAVDPEWVARFLVWLRGPEANIRTASIMGAAEYARLKGPNRRGVISSVLQRADEPGEFIAYMASRYGKTLPGGMQRGVADAVAKLFNEYSAQKYDGIGSGAFRLGDVIEMTHPRPNDTAQAALFTYLLDSRHHSTEIRANLELLPQIAEARRLENVPVEERRALLKSDPDALRRAGKTWEWLSGWLPGGMDKDAWEAMLGADAKGMPYMALLRNIRNFEDAKVSKDILAKVAARICDPEEVAKSRQFPFRYMSAYKTTSIMFAAAFEQAIELSTLNIPDLSGTLIAVDTSASMTTEGISGRSKVVPLDVAALVAMAVYNRSEDCEVVIFGNSNMKVPGLTKQTGVLRGIEKIQGLVGRVGHASYGHTAVRDHFNPNKHKRSFLFTDGALHDSDGEKNVPSLYTFVIGGYGRSTTKVGTNGRYEIGGFTDSTFKMISLLERGRNADWPF